jgi:thiamine-monophosphate kinase
MKHTIQNLGEFGLIDRLSRLLKIGRGVICGIGDDAAVLKVDGKKRLLMTADMLVEGVHFIRKMPARSIGWKAMACSISDIAAMGGIPKFAVVSIGLPLKTDVKWAQDLYAGMEAVSRKFGVSIVGGDTVQSKKIVINVALTGEADAKDVVLRSGAKPGDVIFVTGKLGNSFKSGRHLKFNPRAAEAQYLVKNFKIHSMIDVSDGLAADLGHILKASHVGAILDAKAIPLYSDAKLENALHDGEDYELIFTVGAIHELPLGQSGKFYPIGIIIKNPQSLFLRKPDGRRVSIIPKGYRHF